ncbi:MAG TPA: hypothetical protein VGI30_11615 [Caulobacteraceae bacterium]
MIRLFLRQVGLGLAAAAVLATCAAIFVAALALTLFALVLPRLGPAGAAATVAAAAGAILLIAGVAIALGGRPKAAKLVPKGKDPFARIVNLLKEKPVTAIAAAIGVGFLAIRNPRYLGIAARSFLEGREPPRRK